MAMPAAPQNGAPRSPGGEDVVEAWRELARRLLGERSPEATGGGGPQLFIKRLPDNLPVEIPIPDGFDVVGGLWFANERLGGLETHVMLDAPLDAEQVSEAYRQLMDSTAGWSERTPPGRPRHGGFVFGPHASPLLFCEEGSGSALVVAPQELAGEPNTTGVRLRLDTGPRTSCTREQPERAAEDKWRIPLLTAPAGVRVLPEGKSATRREPDFESSSSMVEANMSLEQIAAHYNTQLAAGGWTLTGEEVSGPQAWSTWEFSDAQESFWAGAFASLGLPQRLPETPRRYSLRVLAHHTEEHP